MEKRMKHTAWNRNRYVNSREWRIEGTDGTAKLIRFGDRKRM
jgi:hypothetical protein